LCLALPEVCEAVAGQHSSFVVCGKKFAYFLVDHHGDGRVAMQCKAAPGENVALVESDPVRFHLPAYMARHGWVGLYLDVGAVDWREVEELLSDAYLLNAPKRLAAKLRPLQ
jgi:phosphoribosylglycinamide formyltransferase-1